MYLDHICVGVVGTNCYVFGDEETKSLAVVDPGDNAEEISAMIRRSGMELKVILLTHGHFDHVTGLPGLLKLYPGTPVWISEKDYAEACKPNMFTNGIGSIPNVNYYGEGDTVAVGKLSVKVLSTPGHTPGSVTLLCEDAMFSGDTLFAGSCGRTDLAGGSTKDIMKSLAKLGRLEGNYRVYPGHESTSTLDAERKYNSFMSYALSSGK